MSFHPSGSLRLLVTASRKWVHPRSVAETLSFYTGLAFSHGERLVVVHGAARDGGDALTSAWVAEWQRRGWPVSQEAHPADWSAPCDPGCHHGPRGVHKDGRTYCQYAGHRRNGVMVASGIHACAAFWRNNSPGTRDCFQKAEKTGVTPLVLGWDDRELVNNDWLTQNAPGFKIGLF